MIVFRRRKKHECCGWILSMLHKCCITYQIATQPRITPGWWWTLRHRPNLLYPRISQVWNMSDGLPIRWFSRCFLNIQHGWIVSQAHKILVSSEMDLPHRMIHYNLNFLAWENKPSSTVQESWERNYHETWWCTVFGWCFLICTKAKNKKWGRDQSENKKIMVGFAGLSFVWRNQHCGSPGDKRSNSNWTWPKRLEMWFGRFNLWQSNMAAKIP